MANRSVKNWSTADRRYGWEIGCDGWATVKETAPELGYTEGYVYELKDMADRPEPGSKAYPLRFQKNPVNKRVRVCRRSIAEFIRIRQPVEV